MRSDIFVQFASMGILEKKSCCHLTFLCDSVPVSQFHVSSHSHSFSMLLLNPAIYIFQLENGKKKLKYRIEDLKIDPDMFHN